MTMTGNNLDFESLAQVVNQASVVLLSHAVHAINRDVTWM